MSDTKKHWITVADSQHAWERDALEFDRSIERAVRELGSHDPSTMAPSIDAAALEGLKFCECLPEELALETLASRLRDIRGRRVIGRPARSAIDTVEGFQGGEQTLILVSVTESQT